MANPVDPVGYDDYFKQALPTDIEKAIPTFFGYMGIACALVFANLGAAYGTAKSGVGICAMGIMKPSSIIKGVIPVIMAGSLGIYGLIVAVILGQKLSGEQTYIDIKKGYQYLGSGLCCGFLKGFSPWPMLPLMVVLRGMSLSSSSSK